MQPNNLRRIVVSLVVLIVVSVGLFVTFQYIQSRKTIEIIFSNIPELKIVEFRTLKPIKTITKSGEKITISKDVRYKIIYKGTEGYASGEMDIDNHKDTVTIKPYYSVEKLDSLLTDINVISLHSKIRDSYLPAALSSYTIQRGRLYNFGEWYSTSLIYNQGYNEISDTLHIIAKKTAGGWEIVAGPNITFNKIYTPTVPIDILQSVNNSN
jgi:hypothetical protein